MNELYAAILEQVIESGTLTHNNEAGQINRAELETEIYYEAAIERDLPADESDAAVEYALYHTDWYDPE